jgi:hypothetical protein
MLLAIAILAVTLGDPPAKPVECEGGRLVKVRTLERAEGAGSGPSPAAPDGRPPSAATGALHFLTLECGGTTWESRVVAGAPDLRAGDLRPRGGLSVRVADGKLFLKRDDGTELETRLADPVGGAVVRERHPDK